MTVKNCLTLCEAIEQMKREIAESQSRAKGFDALGGPDAAEIAIQKAAREALAKLRAEARAMGCQCEDDGGPGYDMPGPPWAGGPCL